MHELGLVEAVLAIRVGRLDPRDYAAALHVRARLLDPSLRAFTVLAEPSAPADGPLGGIPVAVKDIVATRDLPTANGSPIYRDHVPEADAWVVARLRDLGASVLGKTVTTEFAWRHPGPTHNPWRLGHTPGGSSSGSAAAVAAGLAPLALGSQTFGSVIRPAAFCGVVGLKPSYGAIPRTGVHPLARSLDHVGLFTRSVADAGLALAMLAGASDADPHGQPLPPFRINPEQGVEPHAAPRLALVRIGPWDQAEPAALACLEAAAERFRAAGARVEGLTLPAPFAGAAEAARTILACEASATYAPLVAGHPDKVSAPLQDLVREGAPIPAVRYISARQLQTELRAGFGAALADFDALLTLPAPGPAPEGLAFTGDPSFCVPFTYLGVPCITLPAGNVQGLPLGIQLVAAYRNDLRLLRIARWCESVLGRPHLFPAL
ncbi:amidase [Methylobacterium nigriterrae]|uniref:amidase n=1 Tax=Methylobacterium nigriterrae TaxID=3127512 RepID=UPI0030134FDF